MKTAQIVVGDRVWIGGKYGERYYGIKTVAKVTPTQIVIDWGDDGYLKRFRRSDGYEIGGGWRSVHIGQTATKRQCDQYDAKQRKDKKEAAAKEKSDAEREELRNELAALFGERAWVGDESWNDRKGFTLELHHLSAERIREIARAIVEDASR